MICLCVGGVWRMQRVGGVWRIPVRVGGVR